MNYLGEIMKEPESLTNNTALEIKFNNGKIEYEIGSKPAKGDIHAGRTNSLRLASNRPFAIFVGELTAPQGTFPKPHGWADRGTPPPAASLFSSPGPGPVYLSDNQNRLDLVVNAGAPLGAHKYSVVVFDPTGVVIDDPQIIID